MANPDHIKWLLEGVEAWNTRREKENFQPDFSEENIPALFDKRPGYSIRSSPGHTMWHSTAWDVTITPLRGINLSSADLRGADLKQVDLSDSDLRGAKLKGINLRAANLTRANLSFAKFEGEADLSHVVLQDAFLVAVDLTGVNFECADLRKANLGDAKLAQARFGGADLIGANLMTSHPWKADLFSVPGDKKNPEVPSNVETQDFSQQSVGRIEELLTACRSLTDRHPQDVLYLRGEGRDCWKLSPAVMRYDVTGGHQGDIEGKMLSALMSRRPEEFSRLTSAFSQWVLAQHHGLKTRFLDITRNPLVALFHACEGNGCDGRMHVFAVRGDQIKPFNSPTISVIANFAKLSRREQNVILGDFEDLRPVPESSDEYTWAMHRLYQLIRSENPSFEERIDPRDFFRVCVVEPQQSFERIRAQSGAFLISAFHKRFERDTILNYNAGIPVYDHYLLTVQHQQKELITKELALINITREALFPGLDETAAAVGHQLWRG